LAGIRNINPRPPGFALHCVFVIHSAHIISLEAPASVLRAGQLQICPRARRASAIWRLHHAADCRASPRTRSGRSRVHSIHGSLGPGAGRARGCVLGSPS
jgi:hypothetical protein